MCTLSWIFFFLPNISFFLFSLPNLHIQSVMNFHSNNVLPSVVCWLTRKQLKEKHPFTHAHYCCTWIIKILSGTVRIGNKQKMAKKKKKKHAIHITSWYHWSIVRPSCWLSMKLNICKSKNTSSLSFHQDITVSFHFMAVNKQKYYAGSTFWNLHVTNLVFMAHYIKWQWGNWGQLCGSQNAPLRSIPQVVRVKLVENNTYPSPHDLSTIPCPRYICPYGTWCKNSAI